MSASEMRDGAPPVVRRIGWYYLVMSALSAWALITASLHENMRWWQIVGLPISLAIGIGLVREQRWAYVTALVFAGINVAWNLLVLTLVLIQPSASGWTLAMIFTLLNFAVLAPPLFLASERGRAWFKRREPAEIAA